MNQLAKVLNEQISNDNVKVLEMLSNLGRNIFMPKGIITQSAEAKKKATKYDATIGISTINNVPMYLDCIYEMFDKMNPSEIFPYAPTTGVMSLRTAWNDKMFRENPSLHGKKVSLPIVVNALTHGLHIVASMFIDKNDYVVLPDKYWDNYRLAFATMAGAEIATYKTFDENNGFNVEGLLEKIVECGRISGKVVVILNFPNNPTGYTPSSKEMREIAEGLVAIAESGTKIVTVSDDAYFCLFHTDDCYTESLFPLLVGRSNNLLPIRLDGATKEEFVWGFRVGFMTFGTTSSSVDQSGMLQALEQKVSGLIRGSISNASHVSQSAVLAGLKHPQFEAQKQKLNNIIKERCLLLKSIMNSGKYDDEFTAYPFNSGYFMCIELRNVESERLRMHLLDNHQVGVISTGATDIRVAFSSVEKSNIEDLFEIIYKAIKELK